MPQFDVDVPVSIPIRSIEADNAADAMVEAQKRVLEVHPDAKTLYKFDNWKINGKRAYDVAQMSWFEQKIMPKIMASVGFGFFVTLLNMMLSVKGYVHPWVFITTGIITFVLLVLGAACGFGCACYNEKQEWKIRERLK